MASRFTPMKTAIIFKRGTKCIYYRTNHLKYQHGAIRSMEGKQNLSLIRKTIKLSPLVNRMEMALFPFMEKAHLKLQYHKALMGTIMCRHITRSSFGSQITHM